VIPDAKMLRHIEPNRCTNQQPEARFLLELDALSFGTGAWEAGAPGAQPGSR
jgi:hypothetical protein